MAGENSKIRENLKIILGAILGRDVRLAIHDAIEEIDSDGYITENKIGNKAISKSKLSDELQNRIFSHLQGEKLTITSPTEPAGSNSKLEPIKVRDDRIDFLKTTSDVGLDSQEAKSVLYITKDGKINSGMDINFDLKESTMVLKAITLTHAKDDNNYIQIGASKITSTSALLGGESGGVRIEWDYKYADNESGGGTFLYEFGKTHMTNSTKGDELNIEAPDIELKYYSLSRPAIQIRNEDGIKIMPPTNENVHIDTDDSGITVYGGVRFKDVNSIGITGEGGDYLKNNTLQDMILDIRGSVGTLSSLSTDYKVNLIGAVNELEKDKSVAKLKTKIPDVTTLSIASGNGDWEISSFSVPEITVNIGGFGSFKLSATEITGFSGSSPSLQNNQSAIVGHLYGKYIMYDDMQETNDVKVSRVSGTVIESGSPASYFETYENRIVSICIYLGTLYVQNDSSPDGSSVYSGRIDVNKNLKIPLLH